MGSSPTWRTSMNENQHRMSGEITKKEIEEGRVLAIISYIPFLCFIPLLSSQKNEFINKHSKQGLALLIIEVISLLFLIDFFSKIFWIIVLLSCVLLAIIGTLKALYGKTWHVPYLGKLLEKYEI